MSPALISQFAMSFDLTIELIVTSSILLPTVLSPTVRSFTTPLTFAVCHATRAASTRTPGRTRPTVPGESGSSASTT